MGCNRAWGSHRKPLWGLSRGAAPHVSVWTSGGWHCACGPGETGPPKADGRGPAGDQSPRPHCPSRHQPLGQALPLLASAGGLHAFSIKAKQ